MKNNFHFVKIYEQSGPVSTPKNSAWFDVTSGARLVGVDLDKFLLKLKIKNL